MTENPTTIVNVPTRPWRRRLFKFSRLLTIIYLGLCLIMYSLQNWIIFPGHASQGQAQSVVRPSSAYELVHLTTADGDPIVALFGAALAADDRVRADAATRPTVLFFYGNAMCLADSFSVFHQFRRLGVNVMIPEYPGYGMSSGKPSERSLYACADGAYEHLMHRADVNHSQIVAAGWSIGAAVAIDLASRRPVAALATFSAFTNMRDMAHNMVPWLPTSLLLSYHFDNEKKMAAMSCPVFIAHGREDRIVPVEMSRRLNAAAKGRAIYVPVDSDHNDIFESGGDQLMEAFGEFLTALRR